MSAPTPLNPAPEPAPEPEDFNWDNFRHFTQWLYGRFASDDRGPWHVDGTGKKTEPSRANIAGLRRRIKTLTEEKQVQVGALLDEMEAVLMMSEKFVNSHRRLGQKADALKLMRGGLFED
jgi:ParB-like chromosome segregation protein Spo0J